MGASTPGPPLRPEAGGAGGVYTGIVTGAVTGGGVVTGAVTGGGATTTLDGMFIEQVAVEPLFIPAHVHE